MPSLAPRLSALFACRFVRRTRLPQFLRWLKNFVLVRDAEIIRHPTTLRMRLIGVSFFVGHIIFGYLWREVYPQPYENLVLRGIASVSGLVFLAATFERGRKLPTRWLNEIYSSFMWFQLPMYFTWMYLCNGGDALWLGSGVAAILLYYQFTDWRIATFGVVKALVIGSVLFKYFHPDFEPVPEPQASINLIVFGFAWAMAFATNISAASLRKQQLRNTMVTMGIMAHELRTPLAAAGLIGDVMGMESAALAGHPKSKQLATLSVRLNALIRSMHHQIDTQISNARQLHLKPNEDAIRASAAVDDAITSYPFSGNSERACVKVTVRGDFQFLSNSDHFKQVLHNLIKNSLYSLRLANSDFSIGALEIEVTAGEGRFGIIKVIDKGVGLRNDQIPKLFIPFESTKDGTGQIGRAHV